MPFPALQAAVIDGRTRTIFYRQDQLQRLHKALVAKQSEIIEAIIADASLSRTEAQIEYSLALSELRERYAELDPKTALEDEYAVAYGKDAGDLRIGYGIVYIKTAAVHTPFYSAIAPLSAAIGAGNSVVLQVGQFCVADVNSRTNVIQGRKQSTQPAISFARCTQGRIRFRHFRCRTATSTGHNIPRRMSSSGAGWISRGQRNSKPTHLESKFHYRSYYRSNCEF